MTVDEFFSKYEGKGINYDGKYGNQCVDLYRQYVKEALSAPQSPPVRGAKDIWSTYLSEHFDRVENTPNAVPQKGDIIIWGSTLGTFGHVAVFVSGDKNSFTSFDQNFPVEGHYNESGDFIGTGVCHFQPHSYYAVLGWLRPINDIITPPVETNPKIDFGGFQTILETYNAIELSVLKSKLHAKDQEIFSNRDLQKNYIDLEADLSKKVARILALEEAGRLDQEEIKRLKTGKLGFWATLGAALDGFLRGRHVN